MVTYRPTCPITGCDRTVSSDKLMCPRHWATVPRNLQRAVLNTWRAYNRAPDATRADARAEYLAAREAAIEAV